MAQRTVAARTSGHGAQMQRLPTTDPSDDEAFVEGDANSTCFEDGPLELEQPSNRGNSSCVPKIPPSLGKGIIAFFVGVAVGICLMIAVVIRQLPSPAPPLPTRQQLDCSAVGELSIQFQPSRVTSANASAHGFAWPAWGWDSQSIGDAIVCRWLRARNAARLPEPDDARMAAVQQEWSSTSKSPGGLRDWFEHAPYAYALPFADGRCIACEKLCPQTRAPHCLKTLSLSADVVIFKGANNNIIDAMSRSGQTEKVFSPTNLAAWADTHCASGLFTFTFARTPMSHFLSGFTEYAYRLSGISAGDGQWAMDPSAWGDYVTSISEVAHEVLRAMLEMDWSLARTLPPNRDDFYPASHMSLLVGPLMHGYRLDFVGRLETMDDDWLRLGQLSDTNVSQYPVPPSAHITSQDPQGARQVMVDLLITREDLRRAVCYFLAVDHEVYGYDLNDCFAGVGLGLSQFLAAPSSSPTR